MTKDELRQKALLKRDSLDNDKIKGASRVIFEKLTALLPYKDAENILIYASMRSEVITDEIILDALSLGKRVFCPKVVDRKNGLMKFVEIDSLEDLKPGYFGIREPMLPSGFVEEDFDPEKSLVVMPLVCFDNDKNKQQTEFGIEPDYNVQLTDEDTRKGIDTIIEAARKLLVE